MGGMGMDGGWRDGEPWARAQAPGPRGPGPSGPFRARGPGPSRALGPDMSCERSCPLPHPPGPSRAPGPDMTDPPFPPSPEHPGPRGPMRVVVWEYFVFSAHEPTCLVIGLVKSTQVLNGQNDLGEKHYLSMFKSSCPGCFYKFRYLVNDLGGSLHILME